MYYIRRIIAFLVDYLLIGFIISFYFFVTKNEIPDYSNIVATFKNIYIFVIPFWSWFIGTLYFSIIESTTLQASFGKILVSLKVTNKEGGKLSFANSFLRNVNKILSTLLFMGGYLVIFFGKNNDALHDTLSNAKVIYSFSVSDCVGKD